MMGAPEVLLLTLAWHGAQSVNMTDMYGTLTSPNYPESYDKEVEVTWNISVPDGFQIKLYFVHFDLEPSYLCEYDFVKVEAEQEVLATFCGREETDTEQVPGDQVITSPRNALSITFRSDFSNEERFSGFEAHYSAVDVDECRDRNDEDLVCDHHCHNYIGGYYCSCRYGYVLHTDNRTCRVECSDSVFTERTGVLSSSDFPKPYPKSSDCLYRIELEDGFQVNLEFDDTFDIEDHPEVTCPYDYIKIQAGEREIGPLCGDRSPGRIQTGNNSIKIFFHSDNSGENVGWRLSYTTVGSQCPVLQPPENGQIEPIQEQYTFKDHVLVTCKHGYRVLKDDEEMEHYQIVCEKNGSWSGTVPTCKMGIIAVAVKGEELSEGVEPENSVVDCGAPQEIENGTVTFEGQGNSTGLGSRIQYSCNNPLHHLYPSENSTYTCTESGKWTSEEIGTKVPSCQPVCGEPWETMPAQQKRIVGGRSAVPGLFPWQTLLMVEDLTRVPEDRWFGSGALLSESWVLTAAHLLRYHRRDASVVPVLPEHIRIHLGLHNIRSKHQAINRTVERVILHPHFNPHNYNNDIALVKLSQPVPLGRLAMPVCLPPPGQNDSLPQPHTLGLVAGWGISNPNVSTDDAVASDPRKPTDVLQYVKLPVVDQEECRNSYASRYRQYNITENMFCAGFYEGGRDTCVGDSGGAFVMEDPLTRRWVAQGLVSWGGPEQCGSQRVYGVYTRVSNYMSWLQNYLDLGSQR